MRVLMLSREFASSGMAGGIGSSVANISAGLAARGHEVHVLSCVRDQEASDTEERGAMVHRRGAVRIPGLANVFGGPLAAWRVEAAVSAWRAWRALGIEFDVVEGPDWMAEALLFAKRRPLPLVLHLRAPLAVVHPVNSEPNTRDFRTAARLERSAALAADFLTAPSELLPEELRRRRWLDREVEVIPHPMWLPAEAPPADATGPVVVAAGRIEPLKGPDVVVEAAAQLARDVPDLKVRFIGRGSGRMHGRPTGDAIRDLAGARGVRCEFDGEVSWNEMPARYADARVVVAASRYDTLPNTAFEAMAVGRPVVCSDRTGVAGLVAHSGGGAVARSGDARSFAEALRPFLLDPGHAAEAGRRARSAVAEHGNPDRVLPLREAAYRRAIDRHGARRRVRLPSGRG